jgi:hypothetical protein
MDTVLLRLDQRDAAIEIVLDRGRVVEAAGEGARDGVTNFRKALGFSLALASVRSVRLQPDLSGHYEQMKPL